MVTTSLSTSYYHFSAWLSVTYRSSSALKPQFTLWMYAFRLIHKHLLANIAIFSNMWDLGRFQKLQWPLRSLVLAPFDRPHIFPWVFYCNYTSLVPFVRHYHLFVKINRDHVTQNMPPMGTNNRRRGRLVLVVIKIRICLPNFKCLSSRAKDTT